MTALAIKKQFDSYLPLLTLPQQELLLQMAKSLLHTETQEQRITLKQYNAEIKLAEQEIAKGKFTTQSDLEKESEQW